LKVMLKHLFSLQKTELANSLHCSRAFEKYYILHGKWDRGRKNPSFKLKQESQHQI
jgi:hypothetical protein